jgi:hypothetical protein
MGQMNAMVELDECRDEVSGGRYPSRVRVGNSNGGEGGDMDEVLKRLGAVETAVSETKAQVAATLPDLATKDDVRVEISALRVEVAEVRTEVGAIAAVIPHLATKADFKEEIGGARGEIAALGEKLSAKIAASETRMVQWTIGIIIAVAGLAFTIAKYGH